MKEKKKIFNIHAHAPAHLTHKYIHTCMYAHPTLVNIRFKDTFIKIYTHTTNMRFVHLYYALSSLSFAPFFVSGCVCMCKHSGKSLCVMLHAVDIITVVVVILLLLLSSSFCWYCYCCCWWWWYLNQNSITENKGVQKKNI